MIYVYSPRNFMYHKNYYDWRGKLFTKYYDLKEGQLLTVCEAIQNFNMTLDEIIYDYDVYIIQLNRRNTVKDENGIRYIVSGCENYDIIC